MWPFTLAKVTVILYVCMKTGITPAAMSVVSQQGTANKYIFCEAMSEIYTGKKLITVVRWGLNILLLMKVCKITTPSFYIKEYQNKKLKNC